MDPRPLSRQQLAKIAGGDPEAIRLLERLFQVAGQLTPDQVAALQILIGNTAKATAVAQNTASRAPNSGKVDYLDFGIGPKVEAERRAWWGADGTLDLGLSGGSVLQVGQETLFYSKNTSGGDIANGTAVMFTGAVGASGRLTFGPAIADGSVSHEYMMGVATQDVADNAFGFVTSFGLVRGINATGAAKTVPEVWADGDLLYFDPAYPGELTKVQPTAPAFGNGIAVVVNAGAGGSGSIFVRMKTGETVNELHDVSAQNPSDFDIFLRDGVSGIWKNAPASAVQVLAWLEV